MKGTNLINRKQLRNYAMDIAKARYSGIPSYTPTQVSKEFYEKAQFALMNWVKMHIETRPKKGKTL
jgi:hypothetical protein